MPGMRGKAGKFERMFTHKGTRKRGILGSIKHFLRKFKRRKCR